MLRTIKKYILYFENYVVTQSIQIFAILTSIAFPTLQINKQFRLFLIMQK